MSESEPQDDRRARWRRVEALFAEVIDLPTHERAGHLARATDDPSLASEVLDLVAVSTSAPEVMRDLVAREASLLAHEATGVRIGEPLDGYRILGKIGEGGMGAVYLAEPLAAAPHGRVAIKVLLLASAQAIARFVDERRILGSLEHPGIVRLRDGGKTPTGLPYLVMDHIDGVPITRFARERGLGVAQRLGLVLEVCAAVQHAHAQRVVHRDIKPSNILVTPDGHAHLLDFGIAKLLDPDAAARRLAHTRTGMPLLTPEYASPEQARGEPVSAASDIYSLGAVLYELLAGVTAVQVTGDPLELLRRICEVEPLPPSVHAPDAVRAEVTGALDDIVAKAMRKDPAQRYATVDALADDLRRHLAGQPVTTGPARLGAPLAKRRGRRWVAPALAAVLLVAAVGWWSQRDRDAGAQPERPADPASAAARVGPPPSAPGGDPVSGLDPRPGPVAIDALRDRLIVLRDAAGGTYAVAPGADARAFYGSPETDKVLYEQAVLQRLVDARGGSWSVAIWAPRVPGHQPGSIARKPDGTYARWCGGDDEAPLVEVPSDEAKTILETWAFVGNPMVRQPRVLARDDAGTYYLVDVLRAEHGGGRHRVFVGPKGHMTQRPLSAVALDGAGDVFATTSGELRIVRATPDGAAPGVTWIEGDRRVALAPLEPSANLRLVYTELGVYTLTGNLCGGH